MSNALYVQHMSPNSVPAGRTRTDYTPRTMLRAAQIMLAKRTLTRKRQPLRLDLTEYRSAEFRYDTQSALRVRKQLDDVPITRDGLKWIHEQDDILFYAERTLDIPFDDFVSHVDISRVGDCFRDVLGINTQVLHRDEQGRPLLQVERIAALAQPNYTAFLGKDELDVYKLEWMEYLPDGHRNWMRTVCSPNGSTRIDDGCLAAIRMPGATRLEFAVHQSFPWPRFMVSTGLVHRDWFRIPVVESAYRRFWNTTVDNLVARYHGHEIGIGRRPR
jgi:hypothetical protein